MTTVLVLCTRACGIAWGMGTDTQVGGTLWIPNVLYNKKTNTFIMWYGNGGWSTATSVDGIHFTPAHTGFSSRFGPKVCFVLCFLGDF